MGVIANRCSLRTVLISKIAANNYLTPNHENQYKAIEWPNDRKMASPILLSRLMVRACRKRREPLVSMITVNADTTFINSCSEELLYKMDEKSFSDACVRQENIRLFLVQAQTPCLC